MKSKKFWVIAVLVVGIIAALWLLNPTEGEVEDEPEEEQSVPVRVATPQEMTVPQRVSYSGSIEAWERAQITGQTGTRIEQIFVREGDEVSRGQLVAKMDDSNLQQAEVELRTARTEMERAERLVEIGAMAGQQLEQARARFETAESNVEMLRENTDLTSPIDGVVTAKYFVAGEQFAAGAQAPSIVTVETIDRLKVVVHVSERYFPVVEAGMNATVSLDMYGEREFEGQVERVNPTIDAETRTFRVEVSVDNSDGELSPGMSARVSLDLGEVSGNFLPQSALQTQPGSSEQYVYVVEDGTARRVYLTVGERFEDLRRIIDGLPDDAQVVVAGMGRLSEGSAVRIVNEEAQDDDLVMESSSSETSP